MPPPYFFKNILNKKTMKPEYQEFYLSIPHELTPRWKGTPQLKALVSYEHENDLWLPDSVQITFSPLELAYIDDAVGVAQLIPAAVQNNLETYLESREEKPAEPDERYETEKQLKGWPQAFRS